MAQLIELDKELDLTKNHFDIWLGLWENALNEKFNGERENEAIARAKNIAAIMQYKIAQTDQHKI